MNTKEIASNKVSDQQSSRLIYHQDKTTYEKDKKKPVGKLSVNCACSLLFRRMLLKVVFGLQRETIRLIAFMIFETKDCDWI